MDISYILCRDSARFPPPLMSILNVSSFSVSPNGSSPMRYVEMFIRFLLISGLMWFFEVMVIVPYPWMYLVIRDLARSSVSSVFILISDSFSFSPFSLSRSSSFRSIIEMTSP